MKLNHALMNNNITKLDLEKVMVLLKKKNVILTQSTQVDSFEKAWSKWLGVKYSIFVNSGSSANYISIKILQIFNKNSIKKEIIVPTLTWVSDVNSIIMNGFKPVFVDINLSNLSMNTDQVLKKINKKTRTGLQRFE
jgi:CDP-6-deoxy-D-xylo-4-hexulose-3-dehydrase